MITEVTGKDFKDVLEQLENPADVSASYWLDDTFDKYRTDENKWLMLLAYQRGYAKAVDDNAIPDYDEYNEADAYERN